MSTVLTDNQIKLILIQRLSTLMEKREWRQAELADASKCSEMTISRIMRGQQMPSVSVLTRIAEALNTTTDYLLGMEKVS